MKKVFGTSVFEGIVIGSPIRVESDFFDKGVKFKGVEEESKELTRVVDEAKDELNKLKQSSDTNDKKYKEILDVHLMVLQDPEFVNEIISIIKEDLVSVEASIIKMSDRYLKRFEEMRKNVHRQNIFDVRDVCSILISRLRRIGGVDKKADGRIIVVKNLSSSMLLEYRAAGIKIKGIILENGFKNAHPGILVSAFEIPTLTNVEDLPEELPKEVILDSRKGFETAIFSPTDAVKMYYIDFRSNFNSQVQELDHFRYEEPVTKCGKRIKTMLRICSKDELDVIDDSTYDGVGLFRTEFYFMMNRRIPSEKEQTSCYKSLVQATGKDHEVGMRTFDLGFDKEMAVSAVYSEFDPSLGVRGIRLGFKQPEMFKSQLRAILKASGKGNVRLIYPMITAAREISEANLLLEQCKLELAREDEIFDQNIKIAAVIEVPSAAIMIDSIIDLVDSVTIGTNDLTQYVLAASRCNKEVLDLYDDLDSSVLRLIKNVVDTCRNRGKPCDVCGEMTNNPLGLIALLSLGVDSVTVAPSALPMVKKIIRNIDLTKLVELREYITSSGSAGKNRSMLNMFYAEALN